MCTSAVLADIIHYKGGGQQAGEKIEETDEYIIIRMKMGGMIKIPKDRIASIERKPFTLAPSVEYQKRKKELSASDAQGHYALALYCMKKNMLRETITELEIALKLDPMLKSQIAPKLKEAKNRDKTMRYEQVKFYARTKQYQRALKSIAALKKFYPGDKIISSANELERQIRSNLSRQKKLKEVTGQRTEEEKQAKILLLGIEQDVDVLLDLLRGKDLRSKAMAIDTLALFGEKKAITPIRKELNNKNAAIKEKAVRALGELKDTGAVDLIIPFLKDKDNRIRTEAVISLGKIGRKKAVAPLANVLKDKNKNIRIMTIRSLGSLGDKKAVQPLISVLEEEDLSVRIEIYKALGNIGSSFAVPMLLKEIKDERLQGQKEIINALGEIGNEEAAAGLVGLLGTLKNTNLIEKAMTDLRKTNSDEAIPAIAKILKNPSSRLRQKAAYELGLTKNKEAIPYLKDPSESVWMEAVKSVRKLQAEK